MRRMQYCARSIQRRGFTLAELMVSLTGALFISIAMFSIAKHTSALYQREARVSTANMTAVIGFERLRADLSRAGFMASPNIQRDPRVCGSPSTDPGWPQQLSTLASVRIEDIPTSQLPGVIAANSLAPQRITLGGNFSSSEAFSARAITEEGGNYVVHLQVQSGAMSRLGYSDAGADRAALLESVFPIGRALRIVDKAGRHHYGSITQLTAGDEPAITLVRDAPAVRFRSNSSIGCGIKGAGTGALVNTVNFIRYTLRNLSDEARYAPVYEGAGPAYDDTRIELVREELDVQGTVIADSTELVAEYAVDLRFRLTVAASPSAPLTYITQAAVSNWAGDPSTLPAGQGPQLVRSVHTWLSIRSREADRQGNTAVADGPVYRINLDTGTSNTFARVRTIQARVALHNQTGITWR